MEKAAAVEAAAAALAMGERLVARAVHGSDRVWVRQQMAGLLPVYGSWCSQLEEAPYVNRVSLAGKRLQLHGARMFVYFLIDSGYLRLLANRCRKEWDVSWDNEWVIRRFLSLYYACSESDL